jgi:hypothetical protein
VEEIQETGAMNVYEITNGCKEELPNGKQLKRFASVVLTENQQVSLITELQGKPLKKPWPQLVVRWDKPKLPKADFPGFDWPALMCNDRALAEVGDVLRATGELYPIRIKGEKSPYHVHNIPRMIRGALDREKTLWRDIAGQKCVHVPAFHAGKITPKTTLFKIPEDHGLSVYYVERSGKAKDGEFKALVEANGLTGLTFELVWTDGRGPRSKSPKREPEQITDRPLKKAEQRDIDLSIKRGLKYLKLDSKSSPRQVQETMLAAIDQIALGKKKVSKSVETDLAVNLGCLWGQTVCVELGWEWCYVTLASGAATYVIVPPNRSHMVAPMDFIQTQLQKRLPEENTSMLVFNMLKGKRFGKSKANAYLHVG